MQRQKRLSVLLFVGSLALAVLTAFLVQRQINSVLLQQKASIHEVAVVVADKKITQGSSIDASMVTIRQIPQGGLQSGVLTAVQAAIGKIANQPIYAGQQLLPQMMTTQASSARLADHVPSGQLAMSVLFNAVNDAGGNIEPGDYVAVLAILSKGYTGTNQDAARIIASHVLVLTAPSMPTTSLGSSGIVATGAEGSTATGATSQAVTLAVSPKTADQIAFASAYGQIDLLLESSSQSPIAPTQPIVTDSTVLGR